jgi:hypothetical protein
MPDGSPHRINAPYACGFPNPWRFEASLAYDAFVVGRCTVRQGTGLSPAKSRYLRGSRIVQESDMHSQLQVLAGAVLFVMVTICGCCQAFQPASGCVCGRRCLSCTCSEIGRAYTATLTPYRG